MLIGLSYPDASLASEAADALALRYEQAALTRTGGQLSDRVAAMGGEAGTPFIMESEDGSSSLVLPLRFRILQEGAPAAFRFFVNLLLSRDLGWLTAGE